MNSASEPLSLLRSGWTRNTSLRYAFLMASLLAPGATPSLLKGSASASAELAACREGNLRCMSGVLLLPCLGRIVQRCAAARCVVMCGDLTIAMIQNAMAARWTMCLWCHC